MNAPLSFRSVLPTLTRLALLAFALFGLSRLVHGDDLTQALGLIRQVGWPLALVLLPTLVAMGLDVTGWQLILGALGAPARWRALFELRLSVEALVLLLPGGSVAGEPAKAALLTRRTDVSLPHAVASLALTKAYLVLTDGVYLTIAATWAAGDVVLNREHATSLPARAAALSALAMLLTGLGLFALLRQAGLASRLARALQRIRSTRLRRWVVRQERSFQEIDASAAAFFSTRRRTRSVVFVMFLLEWLVEGAETLLIVRCLGLPLPLGPILALDALGSLLRVVVFFVPAGLGVQDATLILLLAALDVPNAVAAGTALVLVKRAKEAFWIATGTALLVARGRPSSSGSTSH
ncbi:MAG TPA: flippase-like domain-containing protein [Polyangia bacterium]|nr:flippase-like domain-containing protein [Polyangia bacterium]